MNEHGSVLYDAWKEGERDSFGHDSRLRMTLFLHGSGVELAGNDSVLC